MVLAVVGFNEIHSGHPLKVTAVIEEELATKLVGFPGFDIVEHRKISEIEAELVKTIWCDLRRGNHEGSGQTRRRGRDSYRND